MKLDKFFMKYEGQCQIDPTPQEKLPLKSPVLLGLSTWQRQALIKLVKNKNKDKRFIKNWRPISLLDVDYKIISKALVTRINKVPPNFTTTNDICLKHIYWQKR